MQFPAINLKKIDSQAEEEEFETIGLQHFFDDTIDERINWETYFGR